MRALVLLAFACGAAPLGHPARPPPKPIEIALWPGAAPDAQPTDKPETVLVKTDEPVAGKPWIEIGEVSRPTITVYPPTAANTGAAVMVMPGGGYQVLAIDLEGTEVCDWLTARGITCVLLEYRVPGESQTPKSGAYPSSPLALEDAQRAMGLVRAHAAEWHVDPAKLGVLGFSAGGHLAAAISTNYAKRLYPPVDAADQESCRPDFAVLLYPGHMHEHTDDEHALNPYVPVTADTPPQLIVQAEDDPVDDIENSLVYFQALERAKVPAEYHVYAHGGHAFGLRPTDQPITRWPALVETWLRTIGVVAP